MVRIILGIGGAVLLLDGIMCNPKSGWDLFGAIIRASVGAGCVFVALTGGPQ